MNKITPEQALGILAQVCAIYRGTKEEHDNLQMALGVIGEVIKPKVETIEMPITDPNHYK